MSKRSATTAFGETTATKGATVKKARPNNNKSDAVGVEGCLVPSVSFVTRIRDPSLNTENPFIWKTVTTEDLFAGKRVVVFALPGAFTPLCSSTMLPGYEQKYNELLATGVDEVYCISVNDAFVMRAWGLKLNLPEDMKTGNFQNVKLIPDGAALFTRGMGKSCLWTSNRGFGERSWRYSMVVNDMVIEKLFSEPNLVQNSDPDPYECSDPDTMLNYLTARGDPRVPRPEIKLNTSNQGKLSEFQRLFAGFNQPLGVTQIDLKEIDSSAEDVIVHKATTAGEGVLVEDTSLDVEGCEVGVNVRWLLDNLNTQAGKTATWRVLLGMLRDGKVFVYEGVIEGSIVVPRGKGGFGFDPVFLPNGTDQTLSQAKPDHVSARAKAVEAFCTGNIKAVRDPITTWTGNWQHE